MQISQAFEFPLCICILQAIKDWRWELPRNEATCTKTNNMTTGRSGMSLCHVSHCFMQAECVKNTEFYRGMQADCILSCVNWVWGACPQNLTPPEIIFACNLGMELTTKPIVSVSHCLNTLHGSGKCDSAMTPCTWLLTTSTAAGVSGLTWPFTTT